MTTQHHEHHEHDENCTCGHEHHNHDEGCDCGHDHHDHDEGCSCGHDHHSHDEGCSCGHDHHDHHDHGEGCSCGHDHQPLPPLEGLSYLQQNILVALSERRYLPVARFAMTKTGEDSLYAIALAPVYLSDPQDAMADVKALGEALQALADHGYITLDYDMELKSYDYTEYKTSALYAAFAATVAEGCSRPDFLFDTPVLELGSMALSDMGLHVMEALLQ